MSDGKVMVDVHAKGSKGGCRHWKGGVLGTCTTKEYRTEHSKKFYHNKKDSVASDLCEKFKIPLEWKDNFNFNPNKDSLSIKFKTITELEEFSKAARWGKSDVLPYKSSNRSYFQRKKEETHKACVLSGISEKWIEYLGVNPDTSNTAIRFNDIQQCELFLSEMIH